MHCNPLRIGWKLAGGNGVRGVWAGELGGELTDLTQQLSWECLQNEDQTEDRRSKIKELRPKTKHQRPKTEALINFRPVKVLSP